MQLAYLGVYTPAFEPRVNADLSAADIVKLSILSATLDDCHELALFVRDYREAHSKPLLAVGMGANGQLSRITSPISLVTHPLIPSPSAPGQLSLAQVHQALHLIGQLPKRDFHLFDAEESMARAFNAAFQELGYPYSCKTHIGTQDIANIIVQPSFGGAILGSGPGDEVGLLSRILWGGVKSSAVNTISVQTDKSGTRHLIGHEVRSGLEVYEKSAGLLEKACQQFSLWTGRRAPRSVIADGLRE
jgi:hypothetical protein